MKLAAAIALVAAVLSAHASTPETPTQKAARMEWWKEARFGLFLHWGTYSVPAGEWKGKTNYAEWIREEAHIPLDQYVKFAQEFNPVKFNADKFATMAKNAGMKYIVITSKHHEGFNMFASKYSDYNIMHTPFHRDVMKELAAACKRHGLKMCFYHSIMDWDHPDYLPRRSWETRSAKGANFDRFVKYLRNDVSQLLKEYGPIGVMWFDGEWESTWNHEYGQALYDLCRKLQPNVIVNNRVDVGRSGVAGMSTTEGTAGDYGTPEQEIPAQGLPGSYWETCMTMNDHWGYNKNDHNYKTAEDLIHKLVDISSKGGNFLLNIGPTALGEFPPEAQDRLNALGKWTKVNGDAIYGTDASPFPSLPWGRCTQKGAADKHMLYLDVFDWPKDGKLVVPGLGNEPVHAYLLANRTKPLQFSRNDTDLVIHVPTAAPDPYCSVVALEIAGAPKVYRAPTILAQTTQIVQPIVVKIERGDRSLETRFTLDGSDPTITSPRYVEPINVSHTLTLKARSFDGSRPVSSVVVENFAEVNPSPALNVASAQPGLKVEVYAGDWDTLPNFDVLSAEDTTTLSSIDLKNWPKKEHFGLRWTGYVDAPADGVYVFELSSDDGSRLRVDGAVVVDNDGLHALTPKTGSAALGKGKHAISIEYFNKTGDLGLGLKWAQVGGKLVPAGGAALWH